MFLAKEQNIVKQFQQQRGWLKKSYQARLLPWSVQAWGVNKLMRRLPWAQRYGGTISGADGVQNWLWLNADLIRAREEFIKRTLADKSFLNDFENGFMAAWQKYLTAEAAYIKQGDYTDAPKLHELCEIESNVGTYGYVNDIFLSMGGEDWIAQWINRELPAKFTLPARLKERESIMADLSTPVQHSFVQEQEIALMEIAMQAENKWPKLLQSHAKKWHWVENSYVESLPLTADNFLQKVKALRHDHNLASRLKQAKSSPSKKHQQKKELIARFNLSAQLQTVIDMSERISHLTDLRKMGVLRLNHFIWEFLRHLARASKQPLAILGWLEHTDMLDIIQNQKWEVLKERHDRGMLIFNYKQERIFLQGEKFQQVDVRSFLEVDKNVIVIKGQVAYKGVVSGTARVIRGRHDFNQFQDQDILITNQTTPEFLPLLKRASAIITEQGGITCHAAIVAREFKIPCIIGVADAMSILTNGSPITIDGEKGEVRKNDN